MREDQLAPFIHAQTHAIAALTQQISTREAIRRVLRTVAVGELTYEQAIKVLEEMGERVSNAPEQAALYRQALAVLRQLEAEET